MQNDELIEFLNVNNLVSNKDVLKELNKEGSAETLEKLIHKGLVDENRLEEALANKYNINILDISEIILPEVLIKKIPKNLIEKHLFIPIQFTNNTLTIAICCPFEPQLLDQLQLLLDCRIEVVATKYTHVMRNVKELLNVRRLKHKGLDIADQSSLHRAVTELLIEKGVITEEELHDKIRQISS